MNVVQAHIRDHANQAVALRVLVSRSPSGDYFVAQGLDIDYVATGKTEEEAQKHFQTGFIETVRAMIQRGRDIGALYTKSSAPQQAWKSFFAAAKQHIFACKVDISGEIAPEVEVPESIFFQHEAKVAIA